MTKHIPEWILRRYALLWRRLGEKEFTKETALKEIGKDSAAAVVLSELRKSGWMKIKINEDDARKNIYQLKDPKKAIMEIIKDIK